MTQNCIPVLDLSSHTHEEIAEFFKTLVAVKRTLNHSCLDILVCPKLKRHPEVLRLYNSKSPEYKVGSGA